MRLPDSHRLPVFSSSSSHHFEYPCAQCTPCLLYTSVLLPSHGLSSPSKHSYSARQSITHSLRTVTNGVVVLFVRNDLCVASLIPSAKRSFKLIVSFVTAQENKGFQRRQLLPIGNKIWRVTSHNEKYFHLLKDADVLSRSRNDFFSNHSRYEVEETYKCKM